MQRLGVVACDSRAFYNPTSLVYMINVVGELALREAAYMACLNNVPSCTLCS